MGSSREVNIGDARTRSGSVLQDGEPWARWEVPGFEVHQRQESAKSGGRDAVGVEELAGPTNIFGVGLHVAVHFTVTEQVYRQLAVRVIGTGTSLAFGLAIGKEWDRCAEGKVEERARNGA